MTSRVIRHDVSTLTVFVLFKCNFLRFLALSQRHGAFLLHAWRKRPVHVDVVLNRQSRTGDNGCPLPGGWACGPKFPPREKITKRCEYSLARSEEISGNWRKLHKEELRNIVCRLSVTKSRRIGRAVDERSTAEMEDAYRVLVSKPKK